jgi:prepilin-type N-terminal cleavage/methylation domain-containing protein
MIQESGTPGLDPSSCPFSPDHGPLTTDHASPPFERGFTLFELMVSLCILGLMAAAVAPNLIEVRRRFDHQRLARQIAHDTLLCRMEALTGCRNVGLVFAQQSGKWYYTMVADRDGDGVSRKDFLAGVDQPLGPKTWLEFMNYDVKVGVPASWHVPDPSGSGLLPPDGMRTGNSDIISFTHLGNATPCTVYINDGKERMLAIRINGTTGVIRALLWRRGWDKWREVTL